MTEKRGKCVEITRDQAIYAGIYTFTFVSFPVLIYSNQTLFKKFCDFHTRLLNLNAKSPGQVVGLSLVMSIIYTSFLCPIYYNGLLRILGLSRITDIHGVIQASAERTYKKYPKMHQIDEKIIFQLDKTFGIETNQTKKYIDDYFGNKFTKK